MLAIHSLEVIGKTTFQRLFVEYYSKVKENLLTENRLQMKQNVV
nr:MAG TPA: hypothetical protein [Caudoviricetes sp.]DAU89093.1 MAG TPA: hypothetical protein [Caudoviricetes sp.]